MLDDAQATLANCHVIVLGGSSGIGRAMATALIANQAKVAILSRRSPEQWEEGPLENWDAKHNLITADLAHTAEAVKLVEQWLQREQRDINILVNSAVTYGVGGRHSFLEIQAQEWYDMFSINVHAPFMITQVLLPYLMQQPKSLILHVSSEVAYNPGPQRIGYSASKSAARFLFSGLAEELKNYQPAVVSILPEGMVDTPGIRKRRDANFDFSSYAPASSFAAPMLALAKIFGASYHGSTLAVSADGSYRVVQNGQIASQSR